MLAAMPRSAISSISRADGISTCSSRWRAARTASRPTRFSGQLEPVGDGLQGRLADAVETALQAGLGTGDQVVGDLLGGEEAVAAVAGLVVVVLPQLGGAGADRAVGVEVTGEAGNTQGAGLVEVARAPVDGHVDAGLGGGVTDQVELVGRPDVRRRSLVPAGHSVGGEVLSSRAGRDQALRGADQLPEGLVTAWRASRSTRPPLS